MGLSCLIDFRETAVMIVAPLIGIVAGWRTAINAWAVARAQRSAPFGSERPAALIEDATAIAGASLAFAEL
jgi:uncharacterized membrane protein